MPLQRSYENKSVIDDEVCINFKFAVATIRILPLIIDRFSFIVSPLYIEREKKKTLEMSSSVFAHVCRYVVRELTLCTHGDKLSIHVLQLLIVTMLINI